MVAKSSSLNSIILFLIYVALALTVIWQRPAISEMTGLSSSTILGIAVIGFLAIALGSALMRRKKSDQS
jgi:hypothetical protein